MTQSHCDLFPCVVSPFFGIQKNVLCLILLLVLCVICRFWYWISMMSKTKILRLLILAIRFVINTGSDQPLDTKIQVVDDISVESSFACCKWLCDIKDWVWVEYYESHETLRILEVTSYYQDRSQKVRVERLSCKCRTPSRGLQSKIITSIGLSRE